MFKKRILMWALALALVFPSLAFAGEHRALIILDGSGSMWGRVGDQPKIDAARKALKDVVGSMPENVDMGLTVYGHRRKDDCSDIETMVPVGGPRSQIGSAIDSIQPKGKTPLTVSIERAAEELRSSEGAATIIVVSDGKETCEGDPCAAAKAAAATGADLRIHVVGFDVTPEEAEQLRCIAEEGNGKYFSAADAAQLASALGEVQKEVVAPEPPPEPAPPKVLFHDTFDGTQLNELWEVHSPDPNLSTLHDGKLIIASQHWTGTGTPSNLHLLNLPIEGDWVATLHVQMSPAKYNEGAGLMYWRDEGNHLHLMSMHGYPSFAKVVGGGERKNVSGSCVGCGYLKVEKRGPEFTAYMSSNNEDWAEQGRHFFLGQGRIGIAAYSWGDPRSAKDRPAEFFEIKVEELR